jgi:peroxiredoxin
MNTKTVPNVVFKTRVRDESMGGENPFRWEDKTTADIFSGKNIIIVALPGAFTPTCSSTHLPGYEKNYQALKAKGVDEV